MVQTLERPSQTVPQTTAPPVAPGPHYAYLDGLADGDLDAQAGVRYTWPERSAVDDPSPTLRAYARGYLEGWQACARKRRDAVAAWKNHPAMLH